MSSSLLYHAFGVRGYEYERTQFLAGAVFFWMRVPRHKWCCSACGCREVIGHGHVVRDLHLVPIGGKAVQLMLRVPRVECKTCGVIRQVELALARPRCTYTRSFERYALELSRFMTIQDVANHLQVSWDLIKELVSRHLNHRYGKPKLRGLSQMAIDEICIGRGQRYLTVVLNLESGRIVFVGQGKAADALRPFWKRLRASHARVRAVAMDMSKAYIHAVHTHLPKATIVFDRFHIVKLFNEKLSDLRRELHREATDKMHKQVLKGTLWLLLKNPENLDEARKERQRLEEALRMNQPLATAYYMKEDLRQFWEQPDKATARRVLHDWIARAQSSGIRMLQQFAKTLQLHRKGILAWYDFPISTGPLEGSNNTIRTMQRQAYGYRDIAFFMLKILALHRTKYALVG